ncbi:MAG: protein-glutamate O-methyltransferase CheR [Marinilabiliaceae bacterium]|nr:protein-glutamate O-methyltransferase CheR [Marinilabiliaceae bacterium]
MDVKTYLKELKAHTPYDFSDYSDNSIHRRLQKVLNDHQLTMDELLEKTRTDKYFVEQLVEEITVNTTEMFRDPDIWIAFYNRIYPLLKNRTSLNFWHAGCSSGQEVYSNIIMLNELGLLERSKVYATDLNSKMINQAKHATYRYRFNKKHIDVFNSKLKASAVGDVSQIEIDKYYDISEENDSMKIKDFIKKIPNFQKHDLVQEKFPFYNKFDIIFCRNVLIYFNTSLQTKIFQFFYDRLHQGGILLLGNHEGLTGFFKTKFTRNDPFYVKNNAFHFKY